MRAFIILLLMISTCRAEPFGYISYTTLNIGDDIQALAVKHFLPPDAHPIDREFVSTFESDVDVDTVINGWYMHTKNFCWYRNDIPPPEVSWPPSPCIRPFFVSFYLAPPFYPEAFTEESIEYLKKHAPIGARDYTTLSALLSHGIPSFFSGCLTLTLTNRFPEDEREKIIYVVDADPQIYRYVKAHSQCKVVKLTHEVPTSIQKSNEARLAHAEQLLEKYSKAHCVITARLHATLPCLALETPVLLISDHRQEGRLHGLKELAWHCTSKELLSGCVDYNINRPPENPQDYRLIREQLIELMENWVSSKTLESGRVVGL